MEYISTRGDNKKFSFSEVFLKGLADDGGLFVTLNIKKFYESIKNKSFHNLDNKFTYVYEFINFERKTHSKLLSKSVKLLCDNSMINKFFTRIADRGINY